MALHLVPMGAHMVGMGTHGHQMQGHVVHPILGGYETCAFMTRLAISNRVRKHLPHKFLEVK